ncbi:hypothetical protein cyc_07863 [Cyclospora cayetanensis]|uniref:Uncharacterized protein n=1 Tax=Cyclospora cayetanensis TaxID=88456 RepID=A0A1D3CWV5_9EIME|nr:hypothetical protein cyc_07863 [Cyclospora cayetanensis]
MLSVGNVTEMFLGVLLPLVLRTSPLALLLLLVLEVLLLLAMPSRLLQLADWGEASSRRRCLPLAAAGGPSVVTACSETAVLQEVSCLLLQRDLREKANGGEKSVSMYCGSGKRAAGAAGGGRARGGGSLNDPLALNNTSRGRGFVQRLGGAALVSKL